MMNDDRQKLNRREKKLLALLAGVLTLGMALGVGATLLLHRPASTGSWMPKICIIPVPTEETAEEETSSVQVQDLGEFKLTAYCPCSKCCGIWADGITYTGTAAKAGRTIAVDPDVIPLGSTVRINGKDYIAEDIGGAIQNKRIDVYFDSHEAALDFGVRYADVSIIK